MKFDHLTYTEEDENASLLLGIYFLNRFNLKINNNVLEIENKN